MQSLFAWLLAAALVGAPAVGVASIPDYVEGVFVVEATSGQLELARAGEVVGHSVVERPAQGDPVDQAEALSREFGVGVSPMVMYQLFAEPTTEPLFPDQWSLENTGQTGGLADADIDANGAWKWTQGVGAVVAVVDSGVELDDAELAPGLWNNPGEVAGNAIDDDLNGFIDDANGWDFVSNDAVPADTVGHGTAVASIITAAIDGFGMAGLASQASLMPVRACDSFGCRADAVARAIVYAVDNGADVINLSLGAPGVEPLVTAAVQYATSHNTLVVAAAGNSALDLDVAGPWTPVNIDDVVGVAWTTETDELAALSNYGATTVDLAAPGEDILSASLGDGHLLVSGSSFSAPHVSGVAALMRSMDPEIAATDLATLLGTTGDPLAALGGVVVSGTRLNAARAVQAAAFRDIISSVFVEDIIWAKVNNITKGCTTTLFCPEDGVTRGQMAAFLSRTLDLPPTTTNPFTDDENSIFQDDINRLAAAGITTGCTPTMYCPDDGVTRGQMAAFLSRALNLVASATDEFTDDQNSIFQDDINRLASAGITTGCTPTMFCPDDGVTRGQMAAFIRRGDALPIP